MSTEKAVAYALGTLQERGQLFVSPGVECYEGMLVGERSARRGCATLRAPSLLGKSEVFNCRYFSSVDSSTPVYAGRALSISWTTSLLRLRHKTSACVAYLSETERRKWAVRNGMVKK